MSTGASNLYDLAGAVLNAVQAGYVAAGLPKASVAYVYGPRNPVAEGESLVVGWGRLFHGTPAGRAASPQVKGYMVARSCELIIWRWLPVTDVLTGEGQDLLIYDSTKAAYDAKVIMTDAYVTQKALVAAHATSVFASYATGLVIGQCVPLAAEGALSGWEMSLTVELS